jgi:hypothetical protein
MDLTGKLNTIHAAYALPTIITSASAAVFIGLLVLFIVKGEPSLSTSIFIVVMGTFVTLIIAMVSFTVADDSAQNATEKQNATAIHQAAKEEGLLIYQRDAVRIAQRRDASNARRADDGDKPIVVLATKNGTATPLLVSWATKNKLTVAPVTGEAASALSAGTND